MAVLLTSNIRNYMSLLVVICITIICHHPCVLGTEVQWIPGPDQQKQAQSSSNKKETAATAPRSQKYWDEHGIERPDYAKTDAELAQERRQKRGGSSIGVGGGSGGAEMDSASTHWKWIIVSFSILGFVGQQWYTKQYGTGIRLGGDGTNQSTFRTKTKLEEELRAARLARFEAVTSDVNINQGQENGKED